MEPLMNTKEAAEALGLHERTVQAMCKSGELPASNLSQSEGRPTWRIAPSDLRAWVEARKAVRP